VRRECALALRAGDVVLLVTPIPTRASFTVFRQTQPRLIAAEVDAARSFASPDIHILDLFAVMRRYVETHHLSYAALMRGPWDPGDRGHREAARLLTNLLRRRFHDRPITAAAQR
jgi:acyl-CoA thioesterase-1